MFFSRRSEDSDNPQNAWLKIAAEHVAQFFDLANPELPLNWLSIENETLNIKLPFVCESQHETLRQRLKTTALQHDMKLNNFVVDTRIPNYQTKADGVINVKNIIAISSGKGGVGKSATAVNVAFALQQEGAAVGMLDADIYGPSLPTMLGAKDMRPQSPDNRMMLPVMAHNMPSNSIGYLVPDEDAAVWRGPMASKALMQLLNETRWPVLDYLIVDMPPGTGDVQLTMAQQVPLTAAVVVTTPQDLALADAQKGIAMFEKVSIPVLGLIENMSSYACSNCGHIEYIFSQNGGATLCDRYDLPLLGSLPLSLSIREYADAGTPLSHKAPDSLLANQYREIARNLSLRLALAGIEPADNHQHIKGDPINVTRVD